MKYHGQYVIPPGAYFLTDEKVGKESPGNFRRGAMGAPPVADTAT